ncbi:MAG: hypothetical protein ACE5Q6_06045 [Dehalococcoidia bacterium]
MTSQAHQQSRIEWRVSRLEEEVYDLRHAIVRLMPPDVYHILMSFYYCASEQEIWSWPDVTADKIIEFAEIRRPELNG